MPDIHIVRTYPAPIELVWKALTDPALVPLWTSTGRGGNPEGFTAEVGNLFRFVGKPFPGWDGIVRCEITAVEQPRLLQYTWRNKPEDRPTLVSYLLASVPTGTQLTWDHTDFRGIEGLFMSILLRRVRNTMLSTGLPAVLTRLDADGNLKSTSTGLDHRTPGRKDTVGKWRRDGYDGDHRGPETDHRDDHGPDCGASRCPDC